MKALIKVGYGCNENCTFCHTQDVRHIDGEAAEVHAKIERAAQLGHTMVVLSGGEPTIRPELFAWAEHSARLGMDFGLVTNGLVLAYPEVIERLEQSRLRYVYQSLHGASHKVHDAIVRTDDAFEAAWKAVKNLAGRGLDYSINVVVVRQNLNHLRELVDAVLPYPDVTLKFSMVQPKGGGLNAFDLVTPRVAEVGRRVHDAITYGLQKTDGRGRYAHDGIPLCLLPGHEHRYDDLKTHGYATMVEIGEPDFFPVDDKAKLQPPACEGCALRGPCPGLYAAYHARYGDGELAPVRSGARSNSFNYVLQSLVATDVPAEACPIREDGVTPWDRGRHLFVRNGKKVARYVTHTRDFSDVELEHIKHETGQLYVDISRKPAPDDFSRDLVPLQRSALCTPCPERERCTGLYEPRFEPIFERDDTRVRALLGEARGDVLDVGCGEGPYDDVLGPLARQGTIRYLGLDPDAAHLEKARNRRGWGEHLVGDLESIDRVFDHVFVLRSWNHLPDPARTAHALVERLRPGGQLTVVDNVAFGLVRTVGQTARAESSSAALEHYRNDDAARALACLLAAAPELELVERHDVGPGTSNQWLLRLVRR